MRTIWMMLCTLLLSTSALAEQKHTEDGIDVHYSAFKSTFLQPEIAAASNLVRSPQQGVLNISLREDGKARAATVRGSMTNMAGQKSSLTFRQVREGQDAIYYLAQFPTQGHETLTFDLDIIPQGQETIELRFSQEFFPE